jgi:hypothetical protein
VGDCVFAGFVVSDGVSLETFGGAEARGEGALGLGHFAADDRGVFSFGFAYSELSLEVIGDSLVFAEYQQAGGAAVETMDQGGLTPAMFQVVIDGVDECVCFVAISGDGQHGGGFVDDDQVVVLEDGAKRGAGAFFRGGVVFRLGIMPDFDDGTRGDFCGGIGAGLVVYSHVAVMNQASDVGPRAVCEGSDDLVEAAGLIGGDFGLNLLNGHDWLINSFRG